MRLVHLDHDIMSPTIAHACSKVHQLFYLPSVDRFPREFRFNPPVKQIATIWQAPLNPKQYHRSITCINSINSTLITLPTVGLVSQCERNESHRNRCPALTIYHIEGIYVQLDCMSDCSLLVWILLRVEPWLLRTCIPFTPVYEILVSLDHMSWPLDPCVHIHVWFTVYMIYIYSYTSMNSICHFRNFKGCQNSDTKIITIIINLYLKED